MLQAKKIFGGLLFRRKFVIVGRGLTFEGDYILRELIFGILWYALSHLIFESIDTKILYNAKLKIAVPSFTFISIEAN